MQSFPRVFRLTAIWRTSWLVTTVVNEAMEVVEVTKAQQLRQTEAGAERNKQEEEKLPPNHLVRRPLLPWLSSKGLQLKQRVNVKEDFFLKINLQLKTATAIETQTD
mgnify:CR=1 FL=1